MAHTVQSTMKQKILKQSIKLTDVKATIETLFKAYAEYCKHNRPYEGVKPCQASCAYSKERTRGEYPDMCVSKHCPTLAETKLFNLPTPIVKPIARLESLGWEEQCPERGYWEWRRGVETIRYDHSTSNWTHNRKQKSRVKLSIVPNK